MSTWCIDRRKHQNTPPHLNHSGKHSIGFQLVTNYEEGEPILLDLDPTKYWQDICTLPLGPQLIPLVETVSIQLSFASRNRLMAIIRIHYMINLLECMIQKKSGGIGNMMTMIVLLMLLGVKNIIVGLINYLYQWGQVKNIVL